MAYRDDLADVRRFAYPSETIAANASFLCFAADNGVNVHEQKGKKCKLGKSNLEVSALGLGCLRMSFGDSPIGDKQGMTSFLLKHHLNRHPVPDRVHQQVYLNPYPKELMLRNRV
jgi:hypothetical protein